MSEILENEAKKASDRVISIRYTIDVLKAKLIAAKANGNNIEREKIELAISIGEKLLRKGSR
jgi:hypothetical protein